MKGSGGNAFYVPNPVQQNVQDLDKTDFIRSKSVGYDKLVEAAGIEPASVDPLLCGLHA